MGIATEILSLRRNQASSVKTLLAALDWTRVASEKHFERARAYAAAEAADIVLLNVAAHAAEALNEPTVRRARRAALPSHRKARRSGSGTLSSQIQHRLFA
jgi:uncharacterized iron-regulated protein